MIPFFFFLKNAMTDSLLANCLANSNQNKLINLRKNKKQNKIFFNPYFKTNLFSALIDLRNKE